MVHSHWEKPGASSKKLAKLTGWFVIFQLSPTCLNPYSESSAMDAWIHNQPCSREVVSSSEGKNEWCAFEPVDGEIRKYRGNINLARTSVRTSQI